MSQTGHDELLVERAADPEAVDRILRALPGWFSVEEAITELVAEAAVLDSYLARRGDQTLGVGLVDRRFQTTAELALLAVDPRWHRNGIGTLVLETIEADLAGAGVRVLEVHTLGPSCDDACYVRTRAFYEARGFAPLNHRVASWSGPVLLLVKALG